MKQTWLPEFDHPDVDEPRPERGTGDVTDEMDVALSAAALPGQRKLFTAERELIGQIEAALSSGRFEDARRYRDALVALEGPSNGTRALGTLDVVGDTGFWDRPLAVVLSDWLTLAQQLEALPNLRRVIADGGLARLLERHGPIELVREAPAMLAPLTNRLCGGSRADDVIQTEAATLLRDALLDGCNPDPADFDDDRLVDLLAEGLPPVWLACLGALRQLWPVPSADPSELRTPTATDSEGEDERGRQFWACLRCTVSCGRDDPAAVAARKRMKQLQPDMHALFMRGGVRVE